MKVQLQIYFHTKMELDSMFINYLILLWNAYENLGYRKSVSDFKSFVKPQGMFTK